MSERKKQIWLRQDQVHLIVACLQYCRESAHIGVSVSSTIDGLARRELMSRIDATLPLFGDTKVPK